MLTQIARTELGVERVAVLPADTSIGSAGSSSASRQTYVTGGAVRAACVKVRERLLARARERFPGAARLSLAGGKVMSAAGVIAELGDLLGEPPAISSTPAIVAAIRAATGLDLTRVPVRPEHITGT